MTTTTTELDIEYVKKKKIKLQPKMLFSSYLNKIKGGIGRPISSHVYTLVKLLASLATY